MKLKNTFRASVLTTLFGLSAVYAADKTSPLDTVNVNVNVNNDQGLVTINKIVNGDEQTIKEAFTVNQGDDVDALVSVILEQHGIDKSYHRDAHKITQLMGQQGKEMLWIQKNDDVNVNLIDGQAKVIIKKDNNGEIEVIEESFDIDDDTDINKLVDDIMAEHGIEAGDAEVHRKVIKIDKHFSKIDNDKPRMGFMANVQDNGWQIISVVPDSGAAEAGLKKGDVVISIDGQSTAKYGLGLTEFVNMDKQVGEVSEVLILRDKQQIPLNIEAKVIDSPDIIMKMNGGGKWFTSSGNDFKFSSGDLDGMFEGLHVDVEHLDKMIEGLDANDIRVVTTADADAYFFSGSKMNQWLGRNHHFSTVTESLGKYFGTTKGVLVLEVDQDNKLGLKDGDVIQAINGKDVNSPKDVVKIMSAFKSDESFEIEIIREKETIYLES